jgi:retron-type reverse transcriptase
MNDSLISKKDEGFLQSWPVSPLLSKIMLDELNKELA